MRKILSLVLTFVMLISLMAPIGTMAQTAAPTVHYYLRDDLSTVAIKYFCVMTPTTFQGEACTKVQGNDSSQDQIWIGCGNGTKNLPSGDLVISIDVYPTETVNKYWFATGGHGQLATNITDSMFERNKWNTLTLVVTRSSNKNVLYVNDTKIGEYTAAIKDNALRFITWATSKDNQPNTVTYLKNFYIYSGTVKMPLISTSLTKINDSICADATATYSSILNSITLSDSNYTKEILYNGASVNGSDTVQNGSKLVVKQGDLFLGDYSIQTVKTITSIKDYHDDLTKVSQNFGKMSATYFEGEKCTK